jgi:soluble lytic murein transglycosylase-like protein
MIRCLSRHSAGLLLILVFSCLNLSFLWLCTPAQADIYRYVDRNGVIHFTNAPTSPGFKVYLHEGSSTTVRKTSYQVRRPSSYSAYKTPCNFDPYIAEAARKHGVSFSLIKAVIRAESNFDPYAVSSAGACGLMQLMPGTARDLGISDPFDPRENILGGTRYLGELLNQFRGSVPMAVAAYNAGPGRVMAVNGIPRIDETQSYVRRVLRFLNRY